MTKKTIAICGANHFQDKRTERRNCHKIANSLWEIVDESGILLELVTGGTAGIVGEIVKGVRLRNGPGISVMAYTPVLDEKELDHYSREGLALPSNYYDSITYSRERKLPIKVRSLARIPRMFEREIHAALAYVTPRAGNTHIEVLSASALSISTFVMTNDIDDQVRYQGICNALCTRMPVRVYSDILELNEDLRKKLGI